MSSELAPKVGKTLRRWIGDSYDYLGLVLISSFVWFTAGMGGAGLIIKVFGSNPIAFLATAAYYVLVIAPVTAGVYYLAKAIVTRDDPSVFDILHGAKKHFAESWSLGLAHLLITLMLAVNAWFYLTREMVIFKVLGILAIYIFLLWVMSVIYHFPIMLEQRPGVFNIIKRGFLVSMDNIGFTVWLFFVIILLTCFLSVTLVGMPLLFMGMMSIMHTRALRAIFIKYEIIPPEREIEHDDDLVPERTVE